MRSSVADDNKQNERSELKPRNHVTSEASSSTRTQTQQALDGVVRAKHLQRGWKPSEAVCKMIPSGAYNTKVKELSNNLVPGKKLHRILETLDDGLLICDASGQILYTNHAISLLLGAGRKTKKIPQKLEKIKLFSLVDGTEISAQKLLTRLQKKRSIRDYQALLKSNKLDRECDPVVNIKAAQLISDDGVFEGAVFTISDITSEKENTFQQQQFIHTIGHELKHPLSCMKAYLYYLKKMAGSKKEEAGEYIEKMSNQIDILTNMLHDVLDITKISSHQFTITPQEGEVNTFLEKVIEDLQLVYKNHHLILQKGDKAQVYFDELRMQQVMMNLLSNAAKYSPNAHEIIVKVVTKKKRVHIHVIDKGIGIPAGEIRAIFRPYFRSSATQKKEFTGLGLGLYLCSEIVDKHHGSISAQSVAGAGTTITISMPLIIEK